MSAHEWGLAGEIVVVDLGAAIRLRPNGGSGFTGTRHDRRRVRLPNNAVKRAGLAGRTDCLIVDVMCRRAARIDVRGVTHSCLALAESGHKKSELRQKSEYGGSSSYRGERKA